MDAKWPCISGIPGAAGREGKAAIRYFNALNNRLVQRSDELFAKSCPPTSAWSAARSGFSARQRGAREAAKRRNRQFLRFTSPVETPYPENNLMNARWFPAARTRRYRDAAVERGRHQPQRAVPDLQLLGISALRLSMPYHDIRRPPSSSAPTTRSRPTSAAPSPPPAKGSSTSAAASTGWRGRDTTSSAWWAPAWARATRSSPRAHDPRISVNAFNHASTSSPTSSGPANRRGTFGRASSRRDRG